MREILKRNLGITNEAFQQQRRVYEQLTNSSILELTREDLVRQVRQYELQQPLFKVRICLPPLSLSRRLLLRLLSTMFTRWHLAGDGNSCCETNCGRRARSSRMPNKLRSTSHNVRATCQLARHHQEYVAPTDVAHCCRCSAPPIPRPSHQYRGAHQRACALGHANLWRQWFGNQARDVASKYAQSPTLLHTAVPSRY